MGSKFKAVFVGVMLLAAGFVGYLAFTRSTADHTAAPQPVAHPQPASAPEPVVKAALRVNRFQVHAERTTGGLSIYLDTDLPAEQEVIVQVSRRFSSTSDSLADDGTTMTEEYDANYVQETWTVDKSRTPQIVNTDDDVVNRAIQRHLILDRHLHPRINSVSQKVFVKFLFGCTDGLIGSAVKPCPEQIPGAPQILDSDIQVLVPYHVPANGWEVPGGE